MLQYFLSQVRTEFENNARGMSSFFISLSHVLSMSYILYIICTQICTFYVFLYDFILTVYVLLPWYKDRKLVSCSRTQPSNIGSSHLKQKNGPMQG